MKNYPIIKRLTLVWFTTMVVGLVMCKSGTGSQNKKSKANLKKPELKPMIHGTKSAPIFPTRIDEDSIKKKK